MSGRVPLQTAMRAAAVQLLTDFKVEKAIKLQIYPARPRTINPPTAFIEGLRETIAFDAMRERTVQVDVLFVWGLFDSKEAAQQRDDCIDDFVDWVTDRYHAAGATTVVEPRRIEDEPAYTPDWLPDNQAGTFYATTLTLEGFAAGG